MEFNAAWRAGLSPAEVTRIRKLVATSTEATARAYAWMQDQRDANPGMKLVAYFEAACIKFPDADFEQLWGATVDGTFGHVRANAKKIRCLDQTVADSERV